MSQVAIIMGSRSDWNTMSNVATVLEKLGIPFEAKVVSAHRTPELVFEFAKSAESKGIKVIVAGAGGAAHLPGMVASLTTIPVIGVPVESKTLKGIDSLLSIVQMPAGIPVATVAIGEAGAKNAGYLVASILSLSDEKIKTALKKHREDQTSEVESWNAEFHSACSTTKKVE